MHQRGKRQSVIEVVVKKMQLSNGTISLSNYFMTIGYLFEFLRMTRPVKSLERVLMDNGISMSSSAANVIAEEQSETQQQHQQQQRIVNYFSINALPPRIVIKRPFCSVCGYLGDYSCTRCGARFCSLRCNESHQETRCLKVSI